MMNTFLCVANEKIYNAETQTYKVIYCAFFIKRFIFYIKS